MWAKPCFLMRNAVTDLIISYYPTSVVCENEKDGIEI